MYGHTSGYYWNSELGRVGGVPHTFHSHPAGVIRSPSRWGHGVARPAVSSPAAGRRLRAREAARRYAPPMPPLTQHTAKRHTAQHGFKPHVPAVHPNRGKHPERAAVLAHLKHLHNKLDAPGMAEHPLTPSEHAAVQEGASALMRGVPSGAGAL